MNTKNAILLLLSLLLFACEKEGNVVTVKTNDELAEAISSATAGDEIIMANGVWKDVEIRFTGQGTEQKPIVLRAETPGKVFIEGRSDLKFGGDYLTVKGLWFRNGYTPSKNVIEFKINSKKPANHCRVTDCVITDYNQMQRDTKDHWVEFWGRHNMLDHCYISGKSNSGPTIMVTLKGNQNIRNYHQIVSNHFGPRPRKGGPHGETIQIGDSYTSMSPCNTNVSNNLFERCDGEVEIISSKTNFNEFRNNVFYKCEGSLVTRHGNYCTIDGNYFIGDDASNNIGGIRIVNTGHWIVNNYFFNLKGENFRSPLAVMNGIPKSPLNRYNQVTDVVVAHNSWVNCKSPLQFGVGTNISQKDVLPLSEIRSATPIRTTVANNLIYNETGDPQPLVAHDNIDGILFESNLINNQGIEFEGLKGLKSSSFSMNQLNELIVVPSSGIDKEDIYSGFDFETIQKDLFGNSRAKQNMIGALSSYVDQAPNILDKSKLGCSWFKGFETNQTTVTHKATNIAGELAKTISAAQSGDIIVLTSDVYNLDKPLLIDKKLTIRASNKDRPAQIVYNGQKGSPAFELQPKGNLILEDIKLKGSQKQYAFANLKENMSSLYNLKLTNVEISNFNYVLKAYKETFADSITFDQCIISNCENGIELSQETNDKGDYNVEFLTIRNCTFSNIQQNVIDYYRGGYDESTIGGNLLVDNCTFTNCGKKEENRILLNTRGIVNVDIHNNRFDGNPVTLVALLWGAKNNHHSNNVLNNSGKIIVEENLKLKMMY